jgi:exopolysaccharide production protein ExoZ
MNKRVESLDWLRGLMAISIMFFHISLWFFNNDVNHSSNLINRLGIYGVAIFFSLSGLSMALVYDNKLNNLFNLLSFFIARFARIWPLYFVSVFFVIIILYYNGNSFSLKSILINLSLTFSFLSPNASMVTGGWSIGNELIYYLLTPLILYFYSISIKIGNWFFICTLITGGYFSFKILNPSLPLSSQWSNYINPFNNLFFYVSGVFVYFNSRRIQINSLINILILFSSFIIFAIIPNDNGQIGIVSGFNRVYFSILSILIVFCFYNFKFKNSNVFTSILTSFGTATYGIYLLHPIVKDFLEFFIDQGSYFNSILIIIFTIGLSLFSYYYFEQPIMKFSKKIVNNHFKFLVD